MPVVQIRRVVVIVLQRLVIVRMGVHAHGPRIVRVRVMPVVVAVGMLV